MQIAMPTYPSTSGTKRSASGDCRLRYGIAS
jgi:hypothetical protein